MKLKNKDYTNVILILIFIIGIIIRLIFMFNLNINLFQYDIGIKNGFNEEFYDKFFDFDRTVLKENGHLEYILRIYSNGKLLESNTNQAYHPPLNHIILASFIKLLDVVGLSNKLKIEALEIPGVVYSILILVLAYKIMKEIGFNHKQIILPFSLITFHPLFIYMSRLINNDQLVILFTLLSILYLLKWYKEPTYKNTIIIAVAIGLGAMSKTSIVVMAIPLIFAYLNKLYKSVENFNLVKKIIIEGILFAIIALPLILWYPVRNFIKFEQPLFSVVSALDILKVNSTTFCDRWILNNELFSNTLASNASNVWAYVINSSIAFMMEIKIIPKTLAIILKIMSLLLIIISFIGFFKYTNKNANKGLLYILCMTYIYWIIGFIFFNISLPYSCTMHARYIVVAMIIGIMYIGIFYNNIKNRYLKFLIKNLIILFEIISIVFILYLVAKLKMI